MPQRFFLLGPPRRDCTLNPVVCVVVLSKDFFHKKVKEKKLDFFSPLRYNHFMKCVGSGIFAPRLEGARPFQPKLDAHFVSCKLYLNDTLLFHCLIL